MIYKVILPLPPVKLSPNQGFGSNRFKHASVKPYRAKCAYLLREAAKRGKWPIPFNFLVLHMEFYLCKPDNFEDMPKSKRPYLPHDADNARASAKAAQDALMDAGIIANDSKDYIEPGKTKVYGKAELHDGRTCLVFTIETKD